MKIFLSLFLILLLYRLTAQKITRRKSGIESDIRSLISNSSRHDFDILHYQFDWDIDYNARYIQGMAVVKAASLKEGLSTIPFIWMSPWKCS